MRCCLISLALLVLVACESDSPPECKTQACLIEQLYASPTRSLDFWQSRLQIPIRDRTGQAPDELIAYLQLDNRINGYPHDVTRTDSPAADELLRRFLGELPVPVQTLVGDKLAGIFVVNNLGSSGYTEQIHDSEGNPVAGVIVLDASLFSLSGNNWATMKDASAFNSEPGFNLRNTIANPELDTPLEAIGFLLIHELAHVISIGEKFHPSWDKNLADFDLAQFPFAGLSWAIEGVPARYTSRFDADFKLRKRLVFYRTPQLDAWQLPEVIEQLKQTNFISLYAATSPEEDFAESFAVYVHSEMMGKPYKMELLVDGQVVDQLGSCFRDRCQGKYELLRELLQP